MPARSKRIESFADRVDAYTVLRVEDPQPGDHFSDHCTSVAFITDRYKDMVWVARPNDKRDGWGEAKPMPLAEFKKWASYESIPGYWLECIPPKDWQPPSGSGGK